jgi:hypothetical protein
MTKLTNKSMVKKKTINFNFSFIYLLIIFEVLIIYFLGPYSGDYNNYKNLIEDVYPDLDFINLVLQDPFFALIALTLSKIGFEFKLIIFLIASSCLVLKNIIFLRYSYSIWISMGYFCSLFWLHEVIQIRTALATTFILISWEFYRANKISSYMIAMFFSVASHMTASIYIVIYLLRKLKFNQLLYLFIFSLIALLFLSEYIFSLILKINYERINRYHETELTSSIIGIFTVLNCLTILQIYYFFSNRNHYLFNKLNRLLIASPFIIIIFIFFGLYMPVLYIRTSQILFLPILMLMCSHIFLKSKLYKLIIIIIIAPLLIYAFPYKNFFIDLI